jgi:hypothetical protein
MWRIAALCMAWTMAWSADDGWQKMKELKAASDIRVFKNGSTKPISAKVVGATDDKLLVTLKNAEVAIDKIEIDHIDFHPPRSKPVKSESSERTADGFSTNTTWSSSASWTRDGWQTVYQKPPNR